MQRFEAFYLFFCAAFLINANIHHNISILHLLFGVITLLCLALYYFTETIRWQAMPVTAVFLAVIAASFFSNTESTLFWRIVALICGGAFILLSLLLMIGMPIRKLPSPTGKYSTGTVTTTLTYELDDQQRELFIEIWYPSCSETSHSDKNSTPVLLWQQIYDKNSFHKKPLQILFSYLKAVSTHSIKNAPLATGDSRFPVLLYSHGLVSFTCENTLLMEEMASQGYIIVACSFTKHYEEYIDVMKNISASVRDNDARLNKKMQLATTREEQSRLTFEYVCSSPGSNKIVQGRISDLRQILCVLPDILQRSVQVENINEYINTDQIGVLGLSLGGAVAIEFCKTESACKAGISLDGAHYGTHQKQPLQDPFLMFNKESTAGCNDFMRESSENDYIDIVVKDILHANFHDQALLFPITRWLGIVGKADPARVNNIRNEAARLFFDKYLKGSIETPLTFEQFPEIEVTFK